MCGRYYRTTDKQQLAEAFHVDATGDSLSYAPGYNIAPTTTQPVVRQARETNQREIVPMRWGLIGFGAAGD
jgi:putative SOS response-associated peptidase YedK